MQLWLAPLVELITGLKKIKTMAVSSHVDFLIPTNLQIIHVFSSDNVFLAHKFWASFSFMENPLVLVLFSLSGYLILMIKKLLLVFAIPLAFYGIFFKIKRYFISCKSMLDGPKQFSVVGSLFLFWRNHSKKS